jgi:hypothetical protein
MVLLVERRRWRTWRGASEGAIVGQGFNGVAMGRSSKGAVAMASWTVNPFGELYGGAIAPAAASMAMCGRERWARCGLGSEEGSFRIKRPARFRSSASPGARTRVAAARSRGGPASEWQRVEPNSGWSRGGPSCVRAAAGGSL